MYLFNYNPDNLILAMDSYFNFKKKDGSELSAEEIAKANEFAHLIISTIETRQDFNNTSFRDVMATTFWFVKFAYVKEYAAKPMREAIKTAVAIYRSKGKNAAIAFCTLIGIHFNGFKSYDYDDIFKVSQLCGHGLDIVKMIEEIATVTDESLESLFTRAIESQIGSNIPSVDLEFRGIENGQRMNMCLKLE
jgi:hypothetical protein